MEYEGPTPIDAKGALRLLMHDVIESNDCHKQAETFTVAPDQPTHGYSGPTMVSRGGNLFPVAQQFLDAVKVHDPSIPQVLDNNDLSTPHGCSVSVLFCRNVTIIETLCRFGTSGCRAKTISLGL